MTKLETLHIVGVMAKRLDALITLRNLATLEISALSVDDEDLPKLRDLKHLRDLTVHLVEESKDLPLHFTTKNGLKIHLLTPGSILF